MVGFILRRLEQSIFVMLAVAFLGVSPFRFVGDPAAQMTGVKTSLEDQEHLRADLRPGLFQLPLTMRLARALLAQTLAISFDTGTG